MNFRAFWTLVKGRQSIFKDQTARRKRLVWAIRGRQASIVGIGGVWIWICYNVWGTVLGPLLVIVSTVAISVLVLSLTFEIAHLKDDLNAFDFVEQSFT